MQTRSALVSEAEIGIFIARVARVSEELSTKLADLMKVVKEMRTFGSTSEKFAEGLQAAKNIRKIGGAVNATKAVGAAINPRTASMAKLGEALAAQGVKHYNALVKAAASPLGKGDPLGAVKEGLMSDTNVDAVKRSLNGEPAEPPYRVPQSSVEETFG